MRILICFNLLQRNTRDIFFTNTSQMKNLIFLKVRLYKINKDKGYKDGGNLYLSFCKKKKKGIKSPRQTMSYSVPRNFLTFVTCFYPLNPKLAGSVVDLFKAVECYNFYAAVSIYYYSKSN